MASVLAIVLLLLASCAPPAPQVGDPPTPFVSDGCSAPGMLHEHFNRAALRACCEIHDAAYWRGGTERQRLGADHLFGACLADTNDADPVEVDLMYSAVRAGGGPCYVGQPPSRDAFCWGYGWIAK